MNNEAEIVVRMMGVTKAFGAQQVLSGVDLEVRRGETLVILGGSGSGKSVLISMLVGLLLPDHGEIEIEGRRVTDFTSEEEWDEVRLKLGFLFQGSALYDSMSVGENIAFPLRQHTSLGRAEIKKRVAEKLALVGLAGVEAKYPAELSGGMQKRAALARTIALDPGIIIYDEPTTGLDPISSELIANLIIDLSHRLRVTSMVVTHDLPCAFRVADRVCLLKKGKMLFAGTPEEVWRADQPELKEFLDAGKIPYPLASGA